MILEIKDIQLGIWVATYTIIVYYITRFFLYGRAQKVMFTFFTLFYWLYNGYGIAFVKGVDPNFFYYYIVFYITFCLSYLVLLRLFYAPFKVVRRLTINGIYRTALSQKLAYVSVLTFLLISFLPLVYPHFKVDRLFNPPKPDIVKQFLESVTGEVNPVVKILSNIGYLIFPFYLMALFYFRKKPFILLVVIFLPLYFHYCNISYINRGLVLERLVIFGSIIYTFLPKIRKYVIIIGTVSLPLILVFAVQYQEIRGGEEAKSVSVGDAAVAIINVEGSFPVLSDKVIRSGKTINLTNYFIWMFTLPIPKVIIGRVQPVSAGAEMAEILLERKQGQKGYFALLAGLLTESVYTFGKKLFFIHAIFCAFFMVIVVRFLEKNTVLFPLLLVNTILFSYTLNRGGISSSLPGVLNQFLFFYIFVIFLFFNSLKKRSQR